LSDEVEQFRKFKVADPFPTTRKSAIRKIVPAAHGVGVVRSDAAADIDKKILIIGATGALGRQVAKTAAFKGYKVTCLVRNTQTCEYLREWGCEILQGNLIKPSSYAFALRGVDILIDASSSRPDDLSGNEASIYDTDGKGKFDLFRLCETMGVKRVIFFSILNADQYKKVPLMSAKASTERLLAQSSLDYTILQGVGFMQGIIDQIALPILEGAAVSTSGTSTKIAYMDTQDMAKFAIAAIERPETVRKSFPLAGPKAWAADELVALCEKASGKEASVSRFPTFLVKAGQNVLTFVGATSNIAERLAFADVMDSGRTIDAPMEETYKAFGMDPAETTTMEGYIKEYYDIIIKSLARGLEEKENDYQY